MARHSSRSKPRASPASNQSDAGSSRIRRAGLIVAGVVALTLLGIGGLRAWRQHARVAEVQAALPGQPPLAGRPTILAQRLAEAQGRMRSSATLLEAVVELGRLYHANQFHREAEACWQILRREQPGEARWCHYLADARRMAGDQAGMIAMIEETLRLDPGYLPARLQLANFQFKSGDATQARDNYQLRLNALPQDPYARLGLARLALQAGKKDEARASLEKLLEDAPHFSSGHNLYAELLAESGDTAAAERHRWLGRETLRYREAEDPWLDELNAWCYDYDRLCHLGTVEMHADRFQAAQAFFERAIGLQPGASAGYELLATLHLRRNEPAQARDLLERALPGLSGGSPAFFATLGDAYRRLQQPAEAIRVARLGLAQNGHAPELLDALALALADTGAHAEALAARETALARSPHDAAMNLHQARSLLALGRLDEALAALDRSLTLQPTYLPTLLLRGEIELEANHLELAEKYLRPAFESHPTDNRARQLLADWHRRMGGAAEAGRDPVSAERHYRDGLDIASDEPELLVSLGLFYLVQGRASDAIAPLATYQRLQPANPQACLFLGQAYATTGRRDQARTFLNQGVHLAERAGHAKVADHCRRILQQL